MSVEDYRRRYEAACHAMQSGVAYELSRDGTSAEPKHLRVGVNSALVDCAALAWLLVRKGVITELELYQALAEGMEAEKVRYEALIAKRYGTKVVLA